MLPAIWKCANEVPVHKRNEKNVKGNNRPISLLPIFGKYLKNSYMTLYTPILCHIKHLTQINQVFAQVT